MSEFRLWLHQKIALLDEPRARRFVALTAALIFVFSAFGPHAIRAVNAVFNSPQISLERIGANHLSNPLSFEARTSNVVLPQIVFIITPASGTPMTVLGRLKSSGDSARWISDEFQGVAGATYTIRAQGMSSMTNQIVESRPAKFSMSDRPDAAATPSAPENSDVAKTIEITQIVAWPGTEPKIEAKGTQSGFKSDSTFFRVKSLTGLAFLGEYPAAADLNGVCQALFKVPGGSLYEVALMARVGDAYFASSTRNIEVPAADALGSEMASVKNFPNANPASVSILLPNSGSELAGPVSLAARVSNATATSLVFEITDPAGVTRALSASAGPNGEWTSVFVGGAGQYDLGVRASLYDGTIMPPVDSKPFKIVATATSTEALTVDESVDGPSVELFSPSENTGPFTGAISIVGRVRNGLPEQVVAMVMGPKKSETYVIATKAPTGDYWTAIFEGADGDYAFKLRATVGDLEYYSAERRFTIKRAVAAAPKH